MERKKERKKKAYLAVQMKHSVTGDTLSVGNVKQVPVLQGKFQANQ